MSRNPVLIVMSVLAALAAVIAGLAQADVLSKDAAAWATLAVAGLTAGVQFYLRGQVTPVVDPRDNAGQPLVPATGEPGAMAVRRRGEHRRRDAGLVTDGSEAVAGEEPEGDGGATAL